MIVINGHMVEPAYFPDGTLKLAWDDRTSAVELTWRYEKSEEMVMLYFLVHHIREASEAQPITLRLPYIPNARMDRTKDRQEVFTLKYFCRFINDLAFERVIVRDPHSHVALALLDRVETEDLKPLVSALAQRLLKKEQDRLFFPDEGAQKRYGDWFSRPHLFGVKKRDWATGQIQGLEIMGEIPEKSFGVLMIDDICCYGGTFFHSARALKALGAGTIWLYVTHCENAILNGELLDSGLIEKVFTTASIYTGSHPKIEIMGGEQDEANTPVIM